MLNQKPGIESIDSYINSFPEPVQQMLRALRSSIREAAPDSEEKISYQMPTFAQQGNLVHFAAYKNHIGFYPAPAAIVEFDQELARYQRSKGAVQFPLSEPLPLDLIRRIVRFRVEQNLKAASQRAQGPRRR